MWEWGIVPTQYAQLFLYTRYCYLFIEKVAAYQLPFLMLAKTCYKMKMIIKPEWSKLEETTEYSSYIFTLASINIRNIPQFSTTFNSLKQLLKHFFAWLRTNFHLPQWICIWESKHGMGLCTVTESYDLYIS